MAFYCLVVPELIILSFFYSGKRLQGSGRTAGFTGFQVELIARGQEIEVPLWWNVPGAVIDGHISLPDHIKTVTPHHNSGVLIQPYPQQVWICPHDLEHIELPVAFQEMLVDGHILDKGHPLQVISDHNGVGLRITPR